MSTPHAYVESAGLKLALYHDRRGALTGARRKILLVHGYPDCAQVWDAVAEQLAQDFEVYRYDVRGCGRSEAPAKPADYHLQHLMDDLMAVIDQISPNAPLHLAGHDWGSMQCWEAVTLPHFAGRFASYTSMSGPCLDHVGQWGRRCLRSGSPRQWLKYLGQLRRSWYMLMLQLPGLPTWFWHKFGAREWPRTLWRLDRTRAQASETRARDGANGSYIYRANILRKLAKPETRRLNQQPVQLLAPTRDPFVSPALFEAIAEACGSLPTHEIAAGHWALLSEPAWVAERIRAFVNAQPR